MAPRAVGGRHELLVDAVAVELQRDAGLGHPLYVPSEVPRVARAAAQLQAEAGQRGPGLSLSCSSSSSGSEAALIVRHITRVANKCCINKYLVTWLTMSSQPDEAPLSVGVHGEHQGQLHAGVAAVEEPGHVPLARPHQLLHAVAEQPGARQHFYRFGVE